MTLFLHCDVGWVFFCLNPLQRQDGVRICSEGRTPVVKTEKGHANWIGKLKDLVSHQQIHK